MACRGLLVLVFLTASVLGQAGNIQTVAVGENGLAFTPDTVTAPLGSVVQFQFYPRNHSVVQGDFDNPCQPTAGGMGFYSGYQVVSSGVAPEVFSVTINDTNPIFFYCSQPIYTHCQAGMVGVINPSTAGDPPQSLDEYRATAMKTNSSSTPVQVQGGVYGPPAPSPSSTSVVNVPPASSVSINTALIGVTLGPLYGAPTTATAAGYMGPGTSTSENGNASSTVSYGGSGACPAPSASARRRK